VTILLEDFEHGPVPGPFPGYPPPNTPSSDYAFDLGFSLKRIAGDNGVRNLQCDPGIIGNPRINAGFVGAPGLDYVYLPSSPLLPYSGTFAGRLTGQANISIEMSKPSNGLGLFFASTWAHGAGVAPVQLAWSDQDFDRGGSWSVVRTSATNLTFTTAWFWDDGSSAGGTYDVTIPSTYSATAGPWIELRFHVGEGFLAKIAGGGTLISEPHPWRFPPDGMFWTASATGSEFGSGGLVQLDYVYGYPGVARRGPAIRKFPRDDGAGYSSASRIFPPPKSGRIVGGYQ
jgi:hypothetical protein